MTGVMDNYRMVSHPCIVMHTLRKFFLTFNRKANYEWVRERAKDGVENYKEAAERLADFSEHLDLPEVSMPILTSHWLLHLLNKHMKQYRSGSMSVMTTKPR